MLRQGGGGSVVGEGGKRRKRRRPHPKCLQCPLLGVKVIKCWFGENVKVLASHFAVQKHSSLPLDSPKGTSCQQLLFLFSFISQSLHHTVPSCHILGKKNRLSIIMLLFFLLLCLYFCFQVHHQASRLPWQQIGMSCWHFTLVLPRVNDDFAATPIPDFTGKVVSGGRWGRIGVCMYARVCGGLTDLGRLSPCRV